jgi:hypothetical protein
LSAPPGNDGGAMQDSLFLGDTLNFTTSVPDYLPTDGWTLRFNFIPRTSGDAFSLVSTQDETDSSLHRTQASAATTADWTAGIFNWHSEVVSGAEQYTVSKGVITLLADPRTATAPYDLRSTAQIALDQALAAYAAWSPTTRSYTIAGREMEFNSPEAIEKYVVYWENRVKDEEIAADLLAGKKNRRKIMVRLGRA